MEAQLGDDPCKWPFKAVRGVPVTQRPGREVTMSSMHHNGHVVAHRGFFPVVIGEQVQLNEAGGMVFIARGNLAVTRGGGQWLVAAGDQTIEQGGGAVLVSRAAHVTNGFVGLVVSARTTLDGNARVLATVSMPVALAAVAGLLLGLVLGRRARDRRESAG
jgi:hypothetical protein